MSALNRIVAKIRVRQHPRVISATADTVINYSDALYGGVVVSNLGAAGAVVFSLPVAKVGMRVKGIVETAQSLRLDPQLTETVSNTSGVTQAAGKYTANATIGSYLGLICLRDGVWDVEDFNGSWTIEA